MEEKVNVEIVAEPNERIEENEKKPKSVVRKKILILSILLVCVCALVVLIIFRSGIPIVDFWTVAGSHDPVKTEITEVERLNATVGTRTDAEGDLVLYEKEDASGNKTYTLINYKARAVIATYSDTAIKKHQVSLNASGDYVWYSILAIAGTGEDARYSLAYYDSEGISFASKINLTKTAYDALTLGGTLDLIRFEDQVYRIGKNGVKKAFTLGIFSTLPAFEKKVDDYYFIEDNDTYFIYNDKGALTATYRAPSSVSESYVFYLSDGTLLSQYVTDVGEHGEDYSYMKNGSKYKIHHVLVSARDGSLDYIDSLDFYIEEVLSDDDYLRLLGLNTGIDNFVIGYPIEDKMLETSEYHLSSILLSDRGRVTSRIGDFIPAMQGGISMIGIAKDRWITRNLAGEYYLLNNWGSVVGSFPEDFVSNVEIAREIFIYEDTVYDWSLNPLYDMKENEIISHQFVGSSVLMHKDDGTVLLFDYKTGDTAVVRTASATDVTVSVLGGALICLETDNGTEKSFALYNEHNTMLISLTGESLVAYMHTIDNAVTLELILDNAGEKQIYVAHLGK